MLTKEERFEKFISEYPKWYEWAKVHHKEESLMQKRTRSAVIMAFRNGTLQRMCCEVCGKTKADAHHDDYNKPLIVRFLCRKHHREFHAKHRYNPNTHKYDLRIYVKSGYRRLVNPSSMLYTD